ADFDALDDVGGERQPRLPWLAGGAVLQIKLGGGGVLDAGLGAHVVAGREHQIGLARRHEVDEGDVRALAVRQVGRPDERRGAASKDVGELDAGEAVDRRDVHLDRWIIKAVAGLVAPQAGAVLADIYNVGGAAAVDVADPDPVGAEAVGAIEDGGAAHPDLAAE